jgi:SAM-dependent methyltransferase
VVTTPEPLDAAQLQEHWDRRYRDAGRHPWGRGQNRTVAAVTAELPPGEALDLGAGDGRNARWLAGRGWRVTAVDISPVALGELVPGSGNRGGTVTAVHADLRTWTPPADRFDLVLLSFLHLPQPHRGGIHRQAARALRPGGTFLLVAHDLGNLAAGVGGPQDPTLLPTAVEVVGELVGLAVLRAEVADREVEGSDRPARDLVVVARRPAHH